MRRIVSPLHGSPERPHLGPRPRRAGRPRRRRRDRPLLDLDPGALAARGAARGVLRRPRPRPPRGPRPPPAPPRDGRARPGPRLPRRAAPGVRPRPADPGDGRRPDPVPAGPPGAREERHGPAPGQRLRAGPAADGPLRHAQHDPRRVRRRLRRGDPPGDRAGAPGGRAGEERRDLPLHGRRGGGAPRRPGVRDRAPLGRRRRPGAELRGARQRRPGADVPDRRRQRGPGARARPRRPAAGGQLALPGRLPGDAQRHRSLRVAPADTVPQLRQHRGVRALPRAHGHRGERLPGHAPAPWIAGARPHPGARRRGAPPPPGARRRVLRRRPGLRPLPRRGRAPARGGGRAAPRRPLGGGAPAGRAARGLRGARGDRGDRARGARGRGERDPLGAGRAPPPRLPARRRGEPGPEAAPPGSRSSRSAPRSSWPSRSGAARGLLRALEIFAGAAVGAPAGLAVLAATSLRGASFPLTWPLLALAAPGVRAWRSPGAPGDESATSVSTRRLAPAIAASIPGFFLAAPFALQLFAAFGPDAGPVLAGVGVLLVAAAAPALRFVLAPAAAGRSPRGRRDRLWPGAGRQPLPPLRPEAPPARYRLLRGRRRHRPRRVVHARSRAAFVGRGRLRGGAARARLPLPYPLADVLAAPASAWRESRARRSPGSRDAPAGPGRAVRLRIVPPPGAELLAVRAGGGALGAGPGPDLAARGRRAGLPASLRRVRRRAWRSRSPPRRTRPSGCRR